MTILITGGSGTTASRLAQALASAPEPYHFLVASRSGKSRNQFPAVVFDWKDETTYGNAFTSPQAQQSPITAVYIVAPNDLDLNTAMTPFLDFAKEKGVKRFVLLSASSIEPGGPMMGSVHKYLLEMGVEYTVLRPTWFMENIVEHGWRLNFIRDQDSIFSATGDGKMPFVSADDIAAVALRALTDEKAHNTDHIILGPELLSYDEVADILTNTLGRKITHVKLSKEEFASTLVAKVGIPPQLAGVLAYLDVEVSKGTEENMSDEVERVTGKRPKAMKEFIEANRSSWMKD